jgi:hypothetical protein
MSETCSICINDFNKSTRAKIICPYGDCSYEACKSCVRTYLLSTSNDPHCMDCRKAFNQKFLVDNLNRSYFDGEYKKHRKKLLLESELSRMPDTMAAANRYKLIMEEQEKLRELQKTTAELNRLLKIENLKVNTIRFNIRNIRNGNVGDLEENNERKKFIMPCPNEKCNGYLSTQYKCDLCSMFTCCHCHELIGCTKTDDHTCNEDAVKTAEMIKKDTKPCPSCGIRIHKISGCDQMWCVGCKTGFYYSTLKIDHGKIHNPHFYEWQAKMNDGTVVRDPGDVACGGLVHISQIRSILNEIERCNIKIYNDDMNLRIKLPNLHRTISHITYYELPQIRTRIHALTDNEELRIKYILNMKNKDSLSDDILRKDNDRQQRSEILHIYELLSVVGIETFANIAAKKIGSISNGTKLAADHFTKNYLEIVDIINNIDALRIYCNNMLAEISVTYNMAVMQIIDDFTISQKKIKFKKSTLSQKTTKSNGKQKMKYDVNSNTGASSSVGPEAGSSSLWP